MPHLTVNGATIYYEERGAGPEAIVFAHGLLWSGRMSDPQVAALQERFRCITFDFRGQGQSQVTETGYDMDTLTEDAAALITRRAAPRATSLASPWAALWGSGWPCAKPPLSATIASGSHAP